jgi:hypothetical protein
VPPIRFVVVHLRYGKWRQNLFRKRYPDVPPRRHWASVQLDFGNLEWKRRNAPATLPDLLAVYCISELITGRLHYGDIVNLMFASKRCYKTIIDTAGSDLELRRVTCPGREKLECWSCQLQLCEVSQMLTELSTLRVLIREPRPVASEYLRLTFSCPSALSGGNDDTYAVKSTGAALPMQTAVLFLPLSQELQGGGECPSQ